MTQHEELDYKRDVTPLTVGSYTLSQIDFRSFYIRHNESGHGRPMSEKEFERKLAEHLAENF